MLLVVSAPPTVSVGASRYAEPILGGTELNIPKVVKLKVPLSVAV